MHCLALLPVVTTISKKQNQIRHFITKLRLFILLKANWKKSINKSCTEYSDFFLYSFDIYKLYDTISKLHKDMAVLSNLHFPFGTIPSAWECRFLFYRNTTIAIFFLIFSYCFINCHLFMDNKRFLHFAKCQQWHWTVQYLCTFHKYLDVSTYSRLFFNNMWKAVQENHHFSWRRILMFV